MADANVIKTFLVEKLIRDEEIELAPDETIFSSGLLDSFSVIQLMRFLEDQFKIRISPSDVVLDDFDTINKIAGLVDRHQSRQSAQ